MVLDAKENLGKNIYNSHLPLKGTKSSGKEIFFKKCSISKLTKTSNWKSTFYVNSEEETTSLWGHTNEAFKKKVDLVEASE